MKEHASKEVVSVVFAFDMAPLYERLGKQKKSLMTGKERYEHLDGQTDYLIDCPFTEEISGMEAETFIKEVLVDQFHAAYIAVGTDFHFGHEKRGDIHMLKQYAGIYGYETGSRRQRTVSGREISSTLYQRRSPSPGYMEVAENCWISVCNEWCGGAWQKAWEKTWNSDDEYHSGYRKAGAAKRRLCVPCAVDGNYYQGIGNLGNKRLWMRMEN